LWDWYPEIVVIPEDPFDAGLEVTDGLANLLVGGLIPLGLTGAEALISHLPPTCQKQQKCSTQKNENKDKHISTYL
jgi:hypothetical protein